MKRILLSLALMFSIPVSALDNPQYYDIKHIFIWDDGAIHIWLEDGVDHGCGGQNWTNKFIVQLNDVAYDAKLSVLLAAKYSKSKVQLGYDCSGNYAYIKRIRS